MKNKIAGAVKIWNMAQGISTAEIEAAIALPVTLAVVGADDAIASAIDRLGRERADTIAGQDVSEHIRRGAEPGQGAGDVIVFDADLVAGSEQALKAVVDDILDRRGEARIGLAKRFPAFRPAVIEQVSAEYARRNAKLAGLSALPGVIPAGDWLLPFTAAGDLVALTRNQVELFLMVAACYGLPPDLRQRTREFAFVVGGAFLWRAAARQAIGFVPAGVGVVVKAAVAYAGTYAIGRAAGAYFASGGHGASSTDVRRYIRDGMRVLRTPRNR
ncbi:MAG: hypothetical protein P4L33_10410 [Capsulimonadaceae bacterium]|nr:hypothetical protein [Capsulimonadaceae bacterium]